MRRLSHRSSLSVRLLLIFALLAASAWAGPIGVFQGELVDSPHGGWLYVKGKNGLFRRVVVGSAHFTYGSQVPQDRRTSDPSSLLVAGTVIKVTAEQGSDGEWRAREIMLVHLAPSRSQSAGTTCKPFLRHCFPVSV